MIPKSIDSLKKRISGLIKKAKKKQKSAKKSKVKAYFEGRQDAFAQILTELKDLKSKLEASLKDVRGEKQEISPQSEEKSPETLLEEALEKGIIPRKGSYYFHEDLPTGKVQGKKKILAALAEKEFHKKIAQQLAKS